MYGVDDIRIEEIPVPVPQTGEILLKVKAAAVCGTDVRMIKNGAAGVDEQHPRILGHEIAGIIEETGDGVTGYEKGMRVSVAPNMGCGICDMCVSGNSHLCPDYKALGINLDGGFAEYCIIPAQAVKSGNVCILEDGVTFDDGAVNEPLSCVCNGFERADIRPGDRVLVIGAGPIGIMHCALTLMAGAVVYLNDVCTERLEEAKRIYPAINIIKGDPEKELPELTGGRGAAAVITACPVPSVQSAALRIAAPEGRVIFFGGVPAAKEPVGIDTNLVHYKQLTLSGTTRASLTQYRRTLRYISDGVLDVSPLVTAHFPLTEIKTAVEKAAKAEGLKNIITFD